MGGRGGGEVRGMGSMTYLSTASISSSMSALSFCTWISNVRITSPATKFRTGALICLVVRWQARVETR